MKKVLTILALFFSVSIFAQSSDGVVNALKEGSAAKFSNYFSSNVDIKLPQDKSERKDVSKADASSAIVNFFSSNNINNFELTSQREMNGTSYITGKLTGGSQSYNLTVMLKVNGNEMSVITVRIG
ncbi:MAG TPA: DUF4783 domain-containing protein [Chitinophagaceae bacterium]